MAEIDLTLDLSPTPIGLLQMPLTDKIDYSEDLDEAVRDTDYLEYLEGLEAYGAIDLSRPPRYIEFTNLESDSHMYILKLPRKTFQDIFCLSQDDAIFLLSKIFDIDFSAPQIDCKHVSLFINFLIVYKYYSQSTCKFEFPWTMFLPQLVFDAFSQLEYEDLRFIICEMSRCIAYGVGKKAIAFPKIFCQQQATVENFEKKHGIQRTLGCLDCLHVKMASPIRETDEYLNEMEEHSLNVELISDHSMNFLSVRCFPGSTPDCKTIQSSPIRDYLAKKYKSVKYLKWLIADKSFHIDKFVLTPYDEPKKPGEIEFNKLLEKVHSDTIGKAVPLILSKYKCLKTCHEAQFNPKEYCFIIRACFALYNLLMTHNRIDRNLPVEALPRVHGEKIENSGDLHSRLMGEYIREKYSSLLARANANPAV